MKYQGPDPIEVWGRTLISLSRHLDQAHRCSLLFALSIVSLHHIFARYSSVVHPGSFSLFEICDFFCHENSISVFKNESHCLQVMREPKMLFFRQYPLSLCFQIYLPLLRAV